LVNKWTREDEIEDACDRCGRPTDRVFLLSFPFFLFEQATINNLKYKSTHFF
jgi:hypothetical protein